MRLKKIVTSMSLVLLSSALLTGCAGDDKEIDKEVIEKYSTPSIASLIEGAPIADASGEGYTEATDKMKKVLENNAKIAFNVYSDSVTTAQLLLDAINKFAAQDGQTQANLDAVKKAWLVSREPYGQSEVYRFRSSPIDDVHGTDAEEDGPEGSLNAWPLGETLIDYVKSGGDFSDAELNVSDHRTGLVDTIGNTNNIISSTITIDRDLLANSASADDERDVIAGYHAIEFLLWGQDLNKTGDITDGTDRVDAVKAHTAFNIAAGGQRPLADFTGDKGERRLKYLQVAAQLMVDELTSVRDAWDKNGSDNYVNNYFLKDNMTDDDIKTRMEEILMGMGTLSEGELAGERMQIALATNSQEDEHSCFSDNTHRDIYLNAQGVYNSFFGTYAGYDSTLDGVVDKTGNAVAAADVYGIKDYLKETAEGTKIAERVEFILEKTKAEAKEIDALARAGKPFDVLIQTKNKEVSEPVRNTILLLNKQSDEIQSIADVMGLGDVVDNVGTNCDTDTPTVACSRD